MVCCEAVRSAIIATAGLLVILVVADIIMVLQSPVLFVSFCHVAYSNSKSHIELTNTDEICYKH